MRSPKTALSAALGLGLAAALTAAAPVSAASPTSPTHSTRASIAAYTGSAAEKADTKAFFQAVMK
ncbi:ABC transporter substrate-binding protein, partial [Streptomyces celluloflavus]